MALSGTVNTTDSYGRYLQLTWTGTQNIENNTTTIQWSVKGAGTASFEWYNAKNISVSVNNQISTHTNSIQLYDGTVVCSGSNVITHNANGSKTITISLSGKIALLSRSGSGIFILDVIPRPTAPSFSASSVAMNGTVTINLNRNLPELTHELSYDFVSLTNQTSGLSATTGVATSATFTPPISLASQIPNAQSARALITCKTYYNSTLIGTKTAYLWIEIPAANVAPIINSVTVTEGDAAVAARFFEYQLLSAAPTDWQTNYATYYTRSGAGTTESPYVYTALSNSAAFSTNTYYRKINYFIQNHSKLSVSIDASPQYGANITGYQTTILNKSYTGNSFNSDVISVSGSVQIQIRVTDSRGITTIHTRTVSIESYSKPTIGYMNVFRINTSGQRRLDGERIAINYRFSIFSLHNLNSKNYEFSYMRAADSGFTSISSHTSNVYVMSDVAGRSFISSPVISGSYTYIIRLSVSDYFETTTYDFEIPTGIVLVDFNTSGRSIAFGKVSERNGMEVDMPIYAYDDITFEPGKRIIQESVSTPTLNSYTYNGTTYSWSEKSGSEARYWKDKNGIVHLSGIVYGGSFSREFFHCIYELPNGYRPAKEEYFSVASGSDIDEMYLTPYSNYLIVIETSGRITGLVGNPTPFSGWLSLSGISFRASN